jgi:site-specific recombinase XerD
MPDKSLLGSWIRRFLMEHLVNERNLAHNTQTSYRDTLALLLPFAVSRIKKPIDRLTIEQITPEIVRSFLAHLEEVRGCSITTRNQRLAAIHALARFVAARSPEHIVWCTSIKTVPFKKGFTPSIPYLEKPEMDALLDAPDRHSTEGMRDYALLLFLYNSGARAEEAAKIKVADLDFADPPAVKILGKGGKTRLSPLWPLTARTLEPLVSGRLPAESVFLNRRRQPITRFGIYGLVKRHAREAGKRVPSILAKRVSPHTIRHATAVHLLRAGVDINTIRAWLGHVSLDTTNIYAEVDLEMKSKALAQCEVSDTKAQKTWHSPGVMAFLKSL